MKKSLITLSLVLTLAGMTVAQAPAQPGAAQQQPAAGQQQAPAAGQQAPAAGQQAPAQQKKEIKDPAEYNAYMAAVNNQDPAAKASALEAFLQTYPNSVIKEDALELLMKTYQQANNVPKIKETGTRLLQVDQNNLTALALLAYLDRMQAIGGAPGAEQMLAEAGQYSERGLQQLQTAPKPEGYSDADWAKMKTSFQSIFQAALGTSALQAKNYPVAQQNLMEAVKANPNSFIDVYQLALSYLEPKPPVVEGLFWGARAVALAQQQAPQAAPGVQKYVRGKYMRYHGGEDGFDALLRDAATQTAPPQGFAIAPAPTPAEQAAQMLKEKPATKMGFGEWVFVLQNATPQDADQVWSVIKDKLLKGVNGIVISATPTVIQVAKTEDAIQAKTPEIELTLTKPLTAKALPKEGTEIIFDGVPVSYTPNPFLMKMSEGVITKGAGAAPAAKKPAAGRPATRKKK